MDFSTDPEFMKKKMEYMRQEKETALHGKRDFIFKKRMPLFAGKEGDNTVRILPPMWEGAMHYGIHLYIHYKVGMNNSQFLCPEQMKVGKCPICEDWREAGKTGDKEMQKAAKYSHRFLCYVINRMALEAGPLLWNMPAGVYSEIMTKADRKTGQFALFDDVKTGRDITFFLTNAGKEYAKYSGVGPDLEVSVLSENEELVDKWLKFCAADPIPTLIDVKPYDYIKSVWVGEIETDKKEEPKQETKNPEMLTSVAGAKVLQEAMKKNSAEAPIVTPPPTNPTPQPQAISKAAIMQMNMDALENLVIANNIDLQPKDYANEEEFRNNILLELGIA